MESESTFVWTQGRIELYTVAAVDLNLILVVFPDHAELDDSLRDGSNLKGGLEFGVLLEEG